MDKSFRKWTRKSADVAFERTDQVEQSDRPIPGFDGRSLLAYDAEVASRYVRIWMQAEGDRLTAWEDLGDPAGTEIPARALALRANPDFVVMR